VGTVIAKARTSCATKTRWRTQCIAARIRCARKCALTKRSARSAHPQATPLATAGPITALTAACPEGAADLAPPGKYAAVCCITLVARLMACLTCANLGALHGSRLGRGARMRCAALAEGGLRVIRAVRGVVRGARAPTSY